MEQMTIGEQIDKSLAFLDELFDICESLARRLTELEKEVATLKAASPNITKQENVSPTLQSTHTSALTTESPIESNIDNPTCEITTESTIINDSPQVSYAVPREQNGTIILSVVSRERRQTAPFIMHIMQNEAKIEYNQSFEWSVESLETKLLSYVDYNIEDSEITNVTQLNPGHAVLTNNRWIVTQKLKIGI